MWVMIFWVCSAGCSTLQVTGFSTEELCKAAVERVEERPGSASAVCVNADQSFFE